MNATSTYTCPYALILFFFFFFFFWEEELGEPARDPGACTSLGGASGGRARAHMGAGTTRTRPLLTTPRNVPSAKNRTLTTW